MIYDKGIPLIEKESHELKKFRKMKAGMEALNKQMREFELCFERTIYEEKTRNNQIANDVLKIITNEEKGEKERRIEACEYILSLIKNMTGEELERHLSEIALDRRDLRLLVTLDFEKH